MIEQGTEIRTWLEDEIKMPKNRVAPAAKAPASEGLSAAGVAEPSTVITQLAVLEETMKPMQVTGRICFISGVS